jgi:hypothetical protein
MFSINSSGSSRFTQLIYLISAEKTTDVYLLFLTKAIEIFVYSSSFKVFNGKSFQLPNVIPENFGQSETFKNLDRQLKNPSSSVSPVFCSFPTHQYPMLYVCDDVNIFSGCKKTCYNFMDAQGVGTLESGQQYILVLNISTIKQFDLVCFIWSDTSPIRLLSF